MPTLHARQNAPAAAATTGFIPTAYGDLDSSPSPGVVVGIVLGSVGGALLLLFLVYSALGCGPALLLTTRTTTTARDLSPSSVRSFRPRKRRRPPRHARATETLEVHMRDDGGGGGGGGGGPGLVPGFVVPGVVPVRPPPPVAVNVPPPPRAHPPRPAAHVEDEVVVIEEHEPPRASRRESGRRSSRRSSRHRSDDHDQRRHGSTRYS